MPRILYVEDNEDNIYMLSARLRRRGYDVAVARDGQEALEAVAARRPALILMDLSLPVLDGWSAARRLKSAPATRDIPIIALSAHAMAGEREKALEAGCDDFDTKPIEFKRLLEKIEAMIGRSAVP
jgi:CheY-like chemotaxis protein